MAASIRRLRTRPARLRQDESAALRQALLPFVDGDGFKVQRVEVRVLAGELLAVVDRETASLNRWSFVMLSPSQNRLVVRHLLRNSRRPLVAVDLWALLFEHLRMDTGEVALRREQMAAALGVEARFVSEVMTELERFGAISRLREGRGVRYFMNPNVGTHLAGKARDDAQAAARSIGLVDLAERRRRWLRPSMSVL